MKNKVILITGVSAGIGKETARLFARKEAITIGAARTVSKLKQIRDEFKKEGLNLHILNCDVSKEKDVKEMTEKIYQDYGKIDVLINNAGTGYRGPVEKMEVEQFDSLMNTNIRGVFLLTKYVLPRMKQKKDGFIINISSGAGRNGIANMAAYCASKFALMGFTESVALEAKPYDVKVSVICPGSTNTEFHEKIGSHPDEEKRKLMIQSEDIAETIYHMVESPKRYWIYEVVTRGFFMGRK